MTVPDIPWPAAALIAGGTLLLLLTACRRGTRVVGAPSCLLVLLILPGTIVAATTDSLVMLFVALKMMSIGQHLLLWRQAGPGAPGARRRVRDSFTFQMAGFATLLLGLAIVYGISGTVWLSDFAGQVSNLSPAEIGLVSNPTRIGTAPVTLAAVLILAGLSALAALPPAHWFSRDLLTSPPTWIVCLQLLVPKAVAVLVVARLIASVLPAWGGKGEARVDTAVAIFAGMALVIGAVAAVRAKDVCGLLSAAAQAHAGFWLVGLAVACWETAHPQRSLTTASGLPGGMTAALFCLCADGLALLGLFAALAYLARPNRRTGFQPVLKGRTGSQPVLQDDRLLMFPEELAGLVRQERAAAAVICVCLLSLAGVPPLPGFWGRLWVLMAAFSPRHASTLTGLYEPHFGFLLLAAVAGLSMVVVAAAYVRLLATLVLDEPLGRSQASGGRAALAAGAVVALVVTAVGLVPGPLLRSLRTEDASATGTEHSPQRDAPPSELDSEAAAPGAAAANSRTCYPSSVSHSHVKYRRHTFPIDPMRFSVEVFLS